MFYLLEEFTESKNREPRVFVGQDIVAQILPEVRAKSSLPRPSDVRLLMVTSNEGERYHSFPNHGHADNDTNNVHFNGQNGVMLMLHGSSAAEQLLNAKAVIEALEAKGIERITPEFIDSEIANPNGSLRQNVSQIYGPVEGAEGVKQQIDRFATCDIIGAEGKSVRVEPIINENFAIGMRAPVNEEVYLLNYSSRLPAYIIGGDYHDVIDGKDLASNALLRGNDTAAEKMDGAFILSNNIVLSVDAASGKTKPIRLETAKDIFEIGKMTVLSVNGAGDVTNQYLPQGPGIKPESLVNDKV